MDEADMLEIDHIRNIPNILDRFGDLIAPSVLEN